MVVTPLLRSLRVEMIAHDDLLRTRKAFARGEAVNLDASKSRAHRASVNVSRVMRAMMDQRI